MLECGVEINWARQDDHGPNVLAVAMSLGLLDAVDQSARLTTISDPARRAERRFAHALMRLLITRHRGLEIALQPFRIEPNGKPSLDQPGSHFSLSHAGDLAIVAISDRAPIGVDCEMIRDVSVTHTRRHSIEEAAASFADAAPLPIDQSAKRFMQAWTRLEAIGKATGEGIGSVLTRVGVRTPDMPRSARAAHFTKFRVVDLECAEGFVAATASSELPPNLAAKQLPNARHTLENWVHVSRSR